METFVIRVFVAAGGEPMPLRGVVEHVGSGSREPFEGADRLVGLLEATLAQAHLHEHQETHLKGELA